MCYVVEKYMCLCFSFPDPTRFCPDPKRFIVQYEQNIATYANKRSNIWPKPQYTYMYKTYETYIYAGLTYLFFRAETWNTHIFWP